MLLARTGYTGEDGFELICEAKDGVDLWRALLSLGALPCGLGARDVLRLEAGYLLSGTDMDPRVDPFEAGLSAFVHLNKSDFLGREALLEAHQQARKRELIGFQTPERSLVPRNGHPIAHQGQPVGKVTSGSYSPALDRNIGLGYVPTELTEPNTNLQVEVRGKLVPILVVPRPFYQSNPKP